LKLSAYVMAAAAGVSLSSVIIAQDAGPQTTPVMVALPTGSELATWTFVPEKPVHKTPVIFLHGGPGMYTTSGVFLKGAPLREAGFTTVYFDQAGGGQSKDIPAKDYTIDRAVADLEAMRASLKQDKIILWGSSYGATLAAIYAVRYPEHVAGVILTSPGWYPGTKASPDYRSSNLGKVDQGKAISAAVNKIDKEGAAAEATLSQDAAGILFDDFGKQIFGGLVCKGSKATLPSTAIVKGGNLYANRMIGKDTKMIKFVTGAAFAFPALIIRGSCDYVPPSHAASFAKLFGTSVTTMQGTGHGLLENRPAIDAAFSAFANGPLSKVD
jgi:pimeloyl-ACP methyl ester carboxylesterase